MDEDVKICPACGAEYFAHVSVCRGCEVELVAPSELEAAREKLPEAQGALVCVEEGSRSRVDDVSREFKRLGIEHSVLNISQGGSSCSGGVILGVFVPQSLAAVAVKAAESLWQSLHPELKETEERLTQGLCPACGASAGDAPVCPDCGLNLSGEEGGPDDGCGTCGPC